MTAPLSTTDRTRGSVGDAGIGASAPATVRRPATVLLAGVRGLWWLAPVGALGMVIPLSLLVAVRIPDSDYRLFYKAPKVITAAQGELFLAAAGALVLGILLPLALRSGQPRRGWPGISAPQWKVLAKAEPIAFRLTVTGYLLLGALGVARGARPGLLVDSITSQNNYTGSLKTLFAPVAGVTSLTQIGISYVVISCLLLTQGRSAVLVRRLIIVLFLGLLRSYLLTERLAILELIVPMLAIGAMRKRRKPHSGWLSLVPILALPVLLVVFGAFEYSRSWVFYRGRTTLSFPAFVVNRLAGYYATSYNNGALQLQHPGAASRLPYDSIQVLWTAPGISQLDLYHRLSGQNGSDLLSSVLLHYGNPEFNNPGGLAVPLVDFGVPGGLVFFLLAGVVVGLTYRGWRSGHPAGLLIYPVLFTGLLELPRYLYWTQGRVFPSLVLLGIVAWAMVRAGQPLLHRAPLVARRTPPRKGGR